MGQHTSDGHKSKDILLTDWIQAVEDSNNSLFPNVNPYRKRLLINRNTQQLIEQYQLQFLNQQDFNRHKDEFAERNSDTKVDKKIEMLSREVGQGIKQSPFIYKIRYFTDKSIEELCSTIYNGLLYVDKVDLRLKQINDIPLLDQLYLYHACLEGFKILYEKVGFFDITEEMIFFNQEGEARVWMNPNLSKHQPNYLSEQSISNPLGTQGSQSEMLKRLIGLIEANTDSHTISNIPHFVDYLKDRGLLDRLSFYKAIDEFQQYCEQNRLTRSRCMRSIYELYHNEEGILFRSQVQRSQVQRVGGGRDYESLKNSQLQQRSLNGQKLGHRPSPDMKLIYKRIQESKVSKNSALIQSSHHGNQYSSVYPRLSKQVTPERRSVINYGQSPVNLPLGNTRVTNAVHVTLKNGPSLQNLSNGNHATFQGSQVQQNVGDASLVTKYKPLEKTSSGTPFSLNSNRPITFSYQGQQGQFLPLPPRPPQVAFNDYKRSSLIQKLNPSAGMRTVISMGTNRSSQAVQTQKQIEVCRKQPKLTYYTSNAVYTLDSEIADDMELYLGINPHMI